jgi:hypothetical protein
MADGEIRPFVPRISIEICRFLQRALKPDAFKQRLAMKLESTPWAYTIFTAIEKAAKRESFGCRMCAQCALPATSYACPMTCPKQLRNGPCGGVRADGKCEVVPSEPCVWVIAYERAAKGGHVGDLRRLQRPIDQRKWGESSWINYWLGRDAHLWTDSFGLEKPESL